MSSSNEEGCASFGACLILIFITVVLGIPYWIWQSSMEAAAFNNATGNHVSTWDAMWIELRVQDAPMIKRNKDE